MNALQVNFVVQDFAAAIRFYSAMFAGPPTVLKATHAEWVLSKPSMRFTICAVDAPRCEPVPERAWLLPNEKRTPQRPALGAGR